MTNTGKVWLVGAGPGDPELLTLKAYKLIMRADALVYDRLVSEAVMQLVPKQVELHFAGKSCKHKAMTQAEIHERLIALARAGKRVVRLKGGDPFFFGRGGEEALALKAAGIAFEVVPGITSAQGCGAYAGIPLTHRGMATGVRFLTGHRTADISAEQPLELDWQNLADPETTLVVYMGLANLEVIAQKLVGHGLPPDFPAAAIASGTTPRQQVVLSDLAGITAQVRQAGLESPVLVVIGKVAGLSAQLTWFSTQATENPRDWPEIFTKMSY